MPQVNSKSLKIMIWTNGKQNKADTEWESYTLVKKLGGVG